jgi:hypothetical protein
MYGGTPFGALPYAAAPTALTLAPAPNAEKYILLSPIDSDAATLGASSAVPSLPVANLQNVRPRKVWRADGTNEWVSFSFDLPYAANCVCMSGHNLTADAVWRVVGASTLAALGSAPDVATAWQTVHPLGFKPTLRYWRSYGGLIRWTNDSAFQFWRVEIADPGNPAGYIEAGRMAMGRFFQGTLNIDFGGTPYGFDPADVQTITPYGEIFTDRRTRSAPRKIAVQVSGEDRRTVMDGVSEIMRMAGMWGDVFCCLDPASVEDFHRLFIQGVFDQPQQHSPVPQFNGNGEVWTIGLSLREV